MQLPQTYFRFLSNREDCKYQVGEVPPEDLKKPSDLYRAYLERLKSALLEMRDLDEPAVFEEARTDPIEWFLLQRRLFWNLQIEQRWSLYELYSIMSNPRPYSPEKQQTIDRFHACQSLHTLYDRLFDRFIVNINFGYSPFIDSRTLSKLLGKMAKCEDLLAAR